MSIARSWPRGVSGSSRTLRGRARGERPRERDDTPRSSGEVEWAPSTRESSERERDIETVEHHDLWVYKVDMRLWPRLPSSPALRRAAPTLGLFGLALLVGGCATDETTDDGADGETTAASGGEGDGDGDTPAFDPVPARGNIHLASVVVNQGVDVQIAADGEWVGPADRNTYIVSGRDTLLRGFWEIPEDWTPRVVRAQLELRYSDGTSTVLADDRYIDGPSFPGDFDRAFRFPIPAEQFPAGTDFHISLLDVDPVAASLPESSTVLEAPIGGFQPIGIQPEPVEMKVILVPVKYSAGSCNTNTAEITEEQEQEFLDYIHEQNPVQEVVWEFRRTTPIEWNTTLTSLAQLWEPLQSMRTADAAPPNAYYYALVDACANGIDGAGGIAPGLAPPTKDAAYMRVSSGLWLDGNDYSYHTMVHELGHNQGRAHIFCAGGNAAGVDPAYPYENGIIGTWGFGIRQFRFHNPTSTFDYMTYCGPNWVSDWTWTKTFAQIRTLTSWDYEGAPADASPEQEVLIGLLLKDGSEHWWTTPGGREDAYFVGTQTVAFEYDGEVVEQPAAIELLDDGSTMITARVPRPKAAIDAATRYADGQAHPIALRQRDLLAP